jgi:hypothetical protein
MLRENILFYKEWSLLGLRRVPLVRTDVSEELSDGSYKSHTV